MTASYNGHVDVVCVLIEAHADVHSQNKVWYTANQSKNYVLTVYCCDFLYTGWLHSTSFVITGRSY